MPAADETVALTSRSRRLAAALRVWLTRPLNVVMALVYAGSLALVLRALPESPPPFEAVETVRPSLARLQWERERRWIVTPGGPQPKPRAVLGPDVLKQLRPGQTEPRPDEVRTLEVWVGHPEAAAAWQPEQYPRVETLSLHGEPISDDQLAALLRIHQPRALYLQRAEKLTAAGFQALANADSIEWLLLSSLPGGRAGRLTWPVNLRWLSVHSFEPLPLARCEEWSRLPRLTTLQVRLSRRDGEELLSPNVIAALDALPSRPTLYLGDLAGGDDGQALALQARFPRLAIRPVSVPRDRLLLAVWAFCLALLPTALGTVALSVQGVLPWAVLTPGFLRPHQLLTACLWLTGAAVSAWLMIAGGVWPVAALALAASGPLYYAGWERVFRHEAMGQAGFVNGLLALVPLGLLLPLLATARLTFEFYPPGAGAFDWFLAGGRPWLAAGWLTLNVVVATRLLRRLSGLVRAVAAGGMEAVPLGMFDVAGWTRVLTPLQARQVERQARWNPLWISRERQLESLLAAGPARTRRQRVALHIAGLALQPREMVVLFLIAALGGTVGFLLFLPLPGQVHLSAILIPLIQAGVTFLTVPLFLLSGRRRLMAHELLWPLPRDAWVADWFAVQVRYLVPGSVMLVLAAAAAWWAGAFDTVGRGTLLAGGVTAVAAVVALWAVSLWLGTYAPLTAGAFFFGAVAAGIAVLFFVAFWMTTAAPARSLSPQTVWTLSAVGTVLLAAGFTALARYRWRSWEVGRE